MSLNKVVLHYETTCNAGDCKALMRLNVSLPGLDRTTVWSMIDRAHQALPRTKPIHGNMDVATTTA